MHGGGFLDALALDAPADTRDDPRYGGRDVPEAPSLMLALDPVADVEVEVSLLAFGRPVSELLEFENRRLRIGGKEAEDLRLQVHDPSLRYPCCVQRSTSDCAPALGGGAARVDLDDEATAIGVAFVGASPS